MWAYFIQGHEISEEDSLIKEKPPTKLSHLFGSVDIQNDMTNRLEMLRKSNDKSDGEEEEKDPDPNVHAFDVDEVLQLTEEEKKNQNSIMKKCPFAGCTVMLVIIKLKKHMFICRFNPHVTGRYKCRYDGCSKTFKYKYRIKNHLLLCRFNPNRVQAPLRQCPYCPVITTSLNAHIYHHHSGGQYICDICGAVKSSKGYLKRHIIYAHQSVEFKCSDCSVVFKTAKSLKNHMLRGHSDIPLELKYKCNECSYKTYSEANFNRHIKYKHDPNGKTIICPDCGKAFGKPSEMKIHSLTHNQDKKFTCDVCSHVCTTAIALKCHKTLHEEWKYECPVCGLKRRSTYEVRMHCGRKHPDYKLPPKGTIMKLTSRLHGRRHYIYSDDEESK
uniref:CSON009852 protein n=1 Tax=Culicoides sonorensis TaxID=179676 RepID=A0A336KI22_CULSO